MKKVLPLFLVCLSAMIPALADDWTIPAKSENFHVFLLMGQSNMEGAGLMVPGDEKPVPGIVLVPTVPPNGLAWQPAAHPLHNRSKTSKQVGLGLSFAVEYRKTHPGVTVGLIPVGWSGQPIDRLNKGTPVYADAIKKAEWAMSQGVVKGVLWHQGESDTVTPDLSDSYAKKLDKLVSDIRSDLALPNLPFVAGQLADFYGTSSDHNAPDRVVRIATVQKALRELPDRVPHTAWVPTKGLKSLDWHMVHFDRESYIELGKRYARALNTLGKNI